MRPYAVVLQPFPPVPFEVKENIMFFCLYDGTELSPFLQAEDLTGAPCDVREREVEFANSFLTVNKETSSLATKVLALSLYVTSDEDVARLSLTAARPIGPRSPSTYGSLCRRLEIRTGHDMNASVAVSLLEKLPNLEILVIRTYWTRAGVPTSTLVQGSFVPTILTCNPKLKRLQFESQREYVTPPLLRSLIIGLQHLTTLHADLLFEDPSHTALQPINCPHPALRVLSVGGGPAFDAEDSRYRAPGEIFSLFPTPFSLPKLRTLLLQRPPHNTRLFLSSCGPQLQVLGLTTADADMVRGGFRERHLIDLCPSLREVMILTPQGLSPSVIDQLPETDTIERVTIVFIPRLRAGMWGGFTLIRQALRSPGIMRQSSLGRIDIIAPPTSSDMIGHTSWFREKCEEIGRHGVVVSGVSTYSNDDQVRAIMALSGHNATLPEDDEPETTTVSLKTNLNWY